MTPKITAPATGTNDIEITFSDNIGAVAGHCQLNWRCYKDCVMDEENYQRLKISI